MIPNHATKVLVDRIFASLTPATRKALREAGFAIQPFLSELGAEFVFLVHYPGMAEICHSDRFPQLQELTRLVFQIANIKIVYVQGLDLSHKIWWNGQAWIQESVHGRLSDVVGEP